MLLIYDIRKFMAFSGVNSSEKRQLLLNSLILGLDSWSFLNIFLNQKDVFILYGYEKKMKIWELLNSVDN
jgi:hypothetical protein